MAVGWMTLTVCLALPYISLCVCGLVIQSYVYLCNFTHVCYMCLACSAALTNPRPLSLSLSFQHRPLEFPGLLCDFRGVERSRAGPCVTE